MKAAFRRARRERVDAGFKAAGLRWAETARLARLREAGEASRDILAIASAMLLEQGRVSVVELQLRLINGHRISPKQATAEVDTFAASAIKKLRQTVSPLACPVTEFGYANHGRLDPTNLSDIRRAVPWGSGTKTHGWVVASGDHDPIYVAYVQHSVNSQRGITKQVTYSTTAAVEAGVLSAPIILPQLPERVA